jgi:pimeloyl-ACP methyl ester carboxylesterase
LVGAAERAPASYLSRNTLERSKMDLEPPKPTVVFVHGAFEDGSIWSVVIQRLQRDGYPVIAFGNPLLGVSVDAAYLRSLLESIEGPVILVAHSYGGAVITQAGADTPRSKALFMLPQ